MSTRPYTLTMFILRIGGTLALGSLLYITFVSSLMMPLLLWCQKPSTTWSKSCQLRLLIWALLWAPSLFLLHSSSCLCLTILPWWHCKIFAIAKDKSKYNIEQKQCLCIGIIYRRASVNHLIGNDSTQLTQSNSTEHDRNVTDMCL